MQEIKEEIKEQLSNLKKELGTLPQARRQKADIILKKFSNSIAILYEAAIKDEKTGVYNFRFFKSILESELEKARRKKAYSV